MKVVVVAVMLFVLTGIFSSCHTSTSTPTPDVVYVPWNMDGMMPSQAFVINGHSILTTNGILVACKISGSIPDTNGVPHSFTSNWETALFKTSISNSFTGGVTDVRFNGVPLTVRNDSVFVHHDVSPVWIDGGSNTWHVGGSAYVPAFDTATITGMPVFSGALPVTVSKTTEFAFNFNAANTANADSAYVVIQGVNGPMYSNVVSAGGGIAKISVSDLAHAMNCMYCNVTANMSTTPYHKGGLIAFVLYNHKSITVDTKQYDLVNQREYLGVISFP
jgi:hypothetical protein